MIEALESLALEAGTAVMALYAKRGLHIESKSDHSPVTEADLLADSLIRKGLQALGDVPIISEECLPDDLHQKSAISRYWLVDPIDGTEEFINQRPTFTVNIALVEDHRVVAGVVYAPALRDLYSGSAATGLRHNQASVQPGPWPTEKTLACSLSHAEAQIEEFARRESIVRRLAIGSSFKFCLLANGSAHVYPRFRQLSAWDIAAGHAVAEAAGCRVLEMKTGKPLLYRYDELRVPSFCVLAPGFELLASMDGNS